MEALQALSNEIGQPGAEKLYRAVERRNLPYNRKQVADFVRAQSTRQVFQKRPKYEGKITAVKINDRWAADLIDYTAKPSMVEGSESPYQYILIVQDIFSRKIFVHALRSETADVVEQAFQSIVRRGGHPNRLDTDDGLEFKGPFDKYLVEEHIFHQVADPRNKNARGTLDAAIKVLRQQLARIQTTEGHRNWADVLQKAADNYNDQVHSALIGRAPDDVAESKELQFDLRWRAGQDMQKNTQLIEARGKRVGRFGAFRDELPSKVFERSFNPRYSDAAHKVKEVKGPYVIDDQGRQFLTRHVLAVPAHSGPVDTSGMHGGSDQTDRLRAQTLEPYKQRISDFLGDLGKYEFEVAAYMKEIGMEPLMTQGLSYRKALRVLGFTVHGNARGSGKQLVTKPAAAPAPAHAPPVLAVRRRLGVKTAA